MTRRFLIAVAVLLYAQTTFAQFGQSNLKSTYDLAARLTRDANDFADANYRNYSNSFRTNRKRR
jgi:hypothetical protein